jgi:DNA repair exonuclease SbcCD ATPase subunit
MDTDRHTESRTHYLSASEADLDPESPEFLNACLDLIKQSPARSLHSADVGGPRGETSPAAHDAARYEESADRQRLARQLETHIDELREALASTQAQIKQSAETLREHEELRQSLAGARQNGETASLQHLVSATISDRDADIAALREARRREGQVRAELDTLRADSTNVRILYDQAAAALEAASQRASQARAEYATAMDVISDRNAAIEQLRRDIATRDREIEDLQRQLLKAEEARIADAAAFIDSLDAYKT